MKQDVSGQDMIYRWKPPTSEYYNGVEAFLEIDNRKCSADEQNGCFRNAEYVSRIILVELRSDGRFDV